MDEIDPPVALADSSNEASREYVLSRALRFTQPGDYDDSFYQHLEQLWAGRGVQDCYERSNVYQLIDCTKYFLDQIKGTVYKYKIFQIIFKTFFKNLIKW